MAYLADTALCTLANKHIGDPNAGLYSIYFLYALITASGCGTILLMVWLWRYYGLIPLFAMAARFAPGRYGIETAAVSYPWKLWWLVPLFVLALMVAKLVLLSLWLSP